MLRRKRTPGELDKLSATREYGLVGVQMTVSTVVNIKELQLLLKKYEWTSQVFCLIRFSPPAGDVYEETELKDL